MTSASVTNYLTWYCRMQNPEQAVRSNAICVKFIKFNETLDLVHTLIDLALNFHCCTLAFMKIRN